MEPSRLRRLLFFLTRNARTTTKELGQLLNISQQMASYSIQKLEEEKLILNYQAIADPAKFGLINVILLLDYQDCDHQKTSAIKKYLKSEPNIIRVEEVSQGADLFVEYCVPNLSYFNKQHKDFLYNFKDSIKVKEAQVVIVKHIYTKNYLHKRYPEQRQIIISGDRDPLTLTEKQTRVLEELAFYPNKSLSAIARKTKLDPKTTTHIKKLLEKQKIIRSYSIALNNETLDITREHLFLTLSYTGPEEEKKFLEYCKLHKNIITLTKVIGTYDVLITTERTDKDKPTITDLRKNFDVRGYHILSSDNTQKHIFLPTNLFESTSPSQK